MKLVCPECKSDVPRTDVDMSSETAFCWHCQKNFACKDWIESALVTPESLQHPPIGAAYEQSPDGFKVVVSTGSYRWLFFLPAACFWSKLAYLFTWALLHPKSIEPGAGWVLIPVLTLFYLLGAALWGGALMPIFGKVAIRVDGDSGSIFTGIGVLGWRRRFNWRGVERIRLTTFYSKKWNREQITLEGDEVIQVARGVSHDRLCYLLTALRQNHRKTSVSG